MQLDVSTSIKAPIAKIWTIITDIENSANSIRAINKIEILEKPETGLIGLKWRETRSMFGKEAKEVMWITASKKLEFYETQAESHGAIYKSKLSLMEVNDYVELKMTFSAESQNLLSTILAKTMGFLVIKSMRKALQSDLEDIKKLAEKSTTPQFTHHSQFPQG